MRFGYKTYLLMECREIATHLYRIDCGGHILKLNLLPFNPNLSRDNDIKPAYAQVQPNGLLFAADLVGIVGLQMADCPPVPRICWDNREHQFWQGFEGSFQTRNVLVNAPVVTPSGDGKSISASYYYIANHVKTSITWTFHDSAGSSDHLMWDTVINIENLSRQPLNHYGQFFACYHPPHENYYWDETGQISVCSSESFNATCSTAEALRLQRTPFHDHIVRNIGQATWEYRQYTQPALLSKQQPWFNRGRHMLFVEPEKCAAIVTWMNQARDYYVCPPGQHLLPGRPFQVRVRHLIAKLDTPDDLQKYWSQFEQSLQGHGEPAATTTS